MAMNSSRRVEANRIVSPALPPVQMTVDPAFTYVGGPIFELYGIAQAEQHLFVIVDEQLVYLIEPDKRNELMIIYAESGDEAESGSPQHAQERAMAVSRCNSSRVINAR